MNAPSIDDFFAEVARLQAASPMPVLAPAEYRLHYDEDGKITQCTMRNHPTDAHYLKVTEQEYRNYFLYRVKNKMLKLVAIDPGHRIQLIKSTSGYEVAKHHASVILQPGEHLLYTEFYDTIKDN